MERLEELRQLIDRADIAYYNGGNPIMEDAQYDRLRDELTLLDPTDPRLGRVGSAQNILSKFRHQIPMGSQAKATNREEFDTWVETVVKATGVADPVFHAGYKMDGGSFSFEYGSGRLVRGVSRGDGKEGEDITSNALNFRNLPSIVLMKDGVPFSGFVRGEVILTLEDWQTQVDTDKLSNPRNSAVGIARRKNGSQSDLLQVFAFRLHAPDGALLGTTEEQQEALLREMGFITAPSVVGNAGRVWDFFVRTTEARKSLPYWIDGLVVKLNDLHLQQDMGETDGRPKGQVAVKFAAEGAKSILRKAHISVGHTGAIIPTAEFDPVQIGGTTVTNASLCNWENIRELGVALGDEIYVIKAGDIIPRIIEVVSQGEGRQAIPEPVSCPVCGGEVGRRDNVSGEESTAVYCQNSECPAKVAGKIERYLTALNILGVGDNLLEALIRDLGVRDAADLYTLRPREEEMAELVLSGKVRLGAKRAAKVLAEIDRCRELVLSDFLGALGIFGLGRRRVEMIQQNVPGRMDQLEDWLDESKLLELAVEAGVPNIAGRLVRDIQSARPLIEKLLANGVSLKAASEDRPAARADARIICITGSLSKPKNHFKALIESAGDIYTDTFSSKVTHLVAADPNSGSSKLKKAAKQGTVILSEEQLLELLGQ